MKMARRLVCWGVLFSSFALSSPAAENKVYLVEKAAPRAVIVIFKNPPRLVKITAVELQAGIEKISGARLLILSDADPAPEGRVRIFIGGERDISSRGTGHACWSSAGLQREAVAYARTMFDHYEVPTLQLSPQDGLRFCQCDDCAKLTPSDAVWSFLDRVARETIRTHPDHFLVGAACTSYRELPESIESLSPDQRLYPGG